MLTWAATQSPRTSFQPPPPIGGWPATARERASAGGGCRAGGLNGPLGGGGGRGLVPSGPGTHAAVSPQSPATIPPRPLTPPHRRPPAAPHLPGLLRVSPSHRRKLTAHTCTDSASVPQCVTKCPPPDGAATPVDEHCLLPPGRADRPASAAPRAAARHTVGDGRVSARRQTAGPTPAVISPSPRSSPGWRPSGQWSGRAVPDSGRLPGGAHGDAGASHGGERTGSGSSGVGPTPLRAMPQSRRWGRWRRLQLRAPL
jgi:hypothetical protein